MNSTMSRNKQPSRKRPSSPYETRRRILVIVIVVLSIVSIVFTLIPVLLIGGMVKGPVVFSTIHSPEDYGLSVNDLILTTSDGLDIVAFEVPVDDPKAIVIFLSGIHNPSVTAFYGHSGMLREVGYASMLVEMRAHGESEGDTIALGFTEYRDVQAAVDYIKEQPIYDETPIVVFGLSMGGATAINAMGQIPELAGVISMSAFSSFEDTFIDNMTRMGMPGFVGAIQRPFVRLYMVYRFGLSSLDMVPKNQITKLGERPALIAHSTDDSQVPYESFERLIAAAPEHVETWTREGDLHFMVAGDHFTDPENDEEYSGRILGFLEKHFGG